jgi:hypothetical protein
VSKNAVTVGDRIKGRDVTGGNTVIGTVKRVIGPIWTPDCGGYRYELSTDITYPGNGKPYEPIVYYEGKV